MPDRPSAFDSRGSGLAVVRSRGLDVLLGSLELRVLELLRQRRQLRLRGGIRCLAACVVYPFVRARELSVVVVVGWVTVVVVGEVVVFFFPQRADATTMTSTSRMLRIWVDLRRIERS